MTGRAPRFVSGFSLLELLAVLAAVALLSTISIGAFQNVMAGRNTARAADAVLGQIALARQTALAKNGRVRWQLIEMGDSQMGGAEAFRLMRLQIFEPGERAWKPLGRPLWLPATVLADPGRSTLLEADALKEIGSFSYGGETNPDAAAAEVVFYASGRTSLDPNKIYSLTLRDTHKEKNFITVQIDPVSGRTRTFQP